MPHQTKTYTAILLDRNADRRTALRECLRNLTFKLEVSTAVSITETIERCHSTPDLDFLMIAAEGGNEFAAIAAKIEEDLKQSAPPLLAVLGAFSQDAGTLVEITQRGFEAAITAPFSVDNVQHAIEQVASSKKYQQFQEARSTQALEILLRFSLAIVDRRAELLLEQRDLPPDDFRNWKRSRAKLESLAATVELEQLAELIEKISAVAKPFADRTPQRMTRRPRKLLHPARVVRRLLDQRGISDDKFIGTINLSADFIKDFLAEKVPVDEGMASELARVLGHTSEYWLSFLPQDSKKVEAE